MNRIYLNAIMAGSMAFAAHAQDQTPSPIADEPATHSAALYEGKYSTGGHAAIHREDLSTTNRPMVGVAALWHSKYVYEGRDNLNNGGIYSFEGVVEWKRFSGGAWFAAGDRESYQELNVFIEYAIETGPLDISLGYARVEFLEDHTDDNEVAAGAALNNFAFLTPSIGYVHSTEADGGFLEVSFKSEIVLFDEQLVLEPYATQAFDFGYASANHDGPNNFQIGIGVSVSIMEHLDLVGSASHSWAQADVERDGLGDVCWGTLGLSSAF